MLRLSLKKMFKSGKGGVIYMTNIGIRLDSCCEAWSCLSRVLNQTMLKRIRLHLLNVFHFLQKMANGHFRDSTKRFVYKTD
jgi:hypothetical protein